LEPVLPSPHDEVFEISNPNEQTETFDDSPQNEPEMEVAVTIAPVNDAVDEPSSSVSLTVEERLIEKLAEFEGKVEALQILKDNLYYAIE
jgi:hypothetical protein